MKFKFKAVLKNIDTGKNERIVEGIYSNWPDAVTAFHDRLYKEAGDRVVKIEMVSKVEIVEVMKEISI